MNVHHIFFSIAALVYNLAMAFGPFFLLAGIGQRIGEVCQNGWKNSSKQLLMIVGAIALLVMITPESIRLQQQLGPKDESEVDWSEHDLHGM